MQAYPIANFSFGQYLAKEPWLSPRNAFQKLLDGHVFRSVLRRRTGYSPFGVLGYPQVDIEVSSPTGAPGLETIVLTNAPLVAAVKGYRMELRGQGIGTVYGWDSGLGFLFSARLGIDATPFQDPGDSQTLSAELLQQSAEGSYRFEDAGGQVVIDDGGGNFTGDVDPAAPNNIDYGVQGERNTTFTFRFAAPVTAVTADYALGTGSIDYETATISDALMVAHPELDAYYESNPQLPCQGIKSFFTEQGSEYLIAFNTRRMWLYNTTDNRFELVTPADVWSGDDKAFFDITPLQTFVVINNGTDPAQKYDPVANTVTPMGVDYDGDLSPDIASARLSLRDRQRLIYFATAEDGSVRNQRARLTPVNDVEYNGSVNNPSIAELFADAPTEDLIVGAFALGKVIVVAFQRELWKLVYTGAADFPYNWERIPSSDGALAQQTLIAESEVLYMLGRSGVIATDGLGERSIDLDIPDFLVSQANRASTVYCQGFRWEEARRVLWSYPDRNEIYPGHVLVMQLDDEKRRRSWSQYRWPFSCYGSWRQNAEKTLDEHEELLDDWEAPLDARTESIGFPIALAGTRTGEVKILDGTHTDEGVAIEFDVESIRLNPYPNQRARMGFADFWFSAARDDSFEVEVTFTSDYNDAPYLSRKFTIDPSDKQPTAGKVVRRVKVNKTATWHTVGIKVSGGVDPIECHAIVPWFAPAGRMRRVS